MVFLVGWFASMVYSELNNSKIEVPFGFSEEQKIPYDRVKESQIKVLNDKIVIELEDATWASYADTNSMIPVLDKGANGLELIPSSESDIYIGDIVAYESSYVDGLVVHRIINIGEDSKGKFYILKGDNNKEVDPEKVRFEQIKYVLIGVIY